MSLLPEDVLQNELARKIALTVAAHPGLGLSEVRDEVGRPGWSNYTFQLNRLETAGIVRSERKGSRRRILFPGNLSKVGPNAPLAKPRGTRDKVARALLASPSPTTTAFLADITRLSREVARYHALLLVNEGLASLQPNVHDERAYSFTPTQTLVDLYKNGGG